ncbi:MAG: hypothetical protein HKN47_24905 [Pirellulaceae bacterium]|nr:hypothetical protein [Pirellulaceae bacterium]
MAVTIATFFIAVSAVLTYILQLCTGFAVAGWTGDHALIDRRKKPGPYWFVMALQTLLLIIVPTLIALAR